ncbi:MAG: hypothetical protein ACRD4Q_06195 [Candidatus Acidiferrales bacterium]
MIASMSGGAHSHSLSEFLQVVAIAVIGPAILYVLTGRLLAAQSPGGKLSWTGRRWRNGLTLAGAIMSGVLLIYIIGQSVPLAVTVPLWALLAYGVIVGVRWLWLDWKKERQARAAYFQKLAEEGKAYSPPPLTGANKAWRWGLNTYAIVFIAALVYALVRYLVRH